MNDNTPKNAMTSPLFEPLKLSHITLKNRLIRSATYEGHGDSNGCPAPGLAELYGKLANGGVGTIITGFVYVSQTGRFLPPCRSGGMECTEGLAQQSRNQKIRNHGNSRKRTENLLVYLSRLGAKSLVGKMINRFYKNFAMH